MRRIVLLVLCAGAIVTGCGGSGDSSDAKSASVKRLTVPSTSTSTTTTSTTTTTTTTVPPTTTTQPPPPPTEAPTEPPTAAPPPPPSNCDPNYSGCVPIASDVDCAGGGGNGPAYVSGPVQVIGQDIYGLDSDGDGIGCE